MQILADNTHSGELIVLIESLDDLWVLYNILRPGDQLKGRTYRRVVLREGDPGERKPMVLLLNIEKIEFHEFSNRLRVLGSILEGPEDWASSGDHHTFNLEPGDKIHIYKDQWLRNDIQRIRRNLERKDESIIFCIALENGLANIGLLSNYSLTAVTEISENIPGKRYKDQGHREAVESFFRQIAQVVEDHLNRYPIALIILCGPGFTKEHFADYLREYLGKIQKHADIRTLTASSGEFSAIHEVLRNGSIASQKADFRMAQEEIMMTRFIEHLGKEDGLMTYGLAQVYQAAQFGAIEHLLICDILLRSSDPQIRNKIEEILNNTESNRGTVHILSTLHPAGDQLESYGKIAGLLRYRLNLESI